MSTTSPQPIGNLDELTHRQMVTGVIKILMGRMGIKTAAGLTRLVPEVGKSTIYSRLNSETDWQTHEIRLLAERLGAPAGVFFEDPTVDSIAPWLDMTPETLAKELAGQYWKMMNGADLEVLPGGDEGGQGRFGHLHLVT